MNNRLTLINNLVDDIVKNDIIYDIKTKYNEELDEYEYIDTIQKFSLLSLKGSLKYVNKYDGKLRYGGLLIKIYFYNNKYYALIKKNNGKKYKISFNSNYIFYLKNKNDILKKYLECFISDYNNGLYELI